MPQPSECRWVKEEEKGKIIGKVIKPGPWQYALVQNYKIIARTPNKIVSEELSMPLLEPTVLPRTKKIAQSERIQDLATAIQWINYRRAYIVDNIQGCEFMIQKKDRVQAILERKVITIMMGTLEAITQMDNLKQIAVQHSHKCSIMFDSEEQGRSITHPQYYSASKPSTCGWDNDLNKGKISGRIAMPRDWQCAIIEGPNIVSRSEIRTIVLGKESLCGALVWNVPLWSQKDKVPIHIQWYHNRLNLTSYELNLEDPEGNTSKLIYRLKCELKVRILTKEQLSRSDPFWHYHIVQEEACDVQSAGQILYNYYCETEDFLTGQRGSGTWKLKGTDFSYPFPFTWITEPKITGIGPYVVKEDIRKQLIIDPTYSLKKVIIDLAPISSIKPQCQKYTEPLDRGWKRWLYTQVFPGVSNNRKKRGIIDTALGGAGTGLGILNSIDVEILANKLSMLGQRLGDLAKPLKNSLTEMSTSQHLVANILPDWESSQRADHLKILDTVEVLQSNLSLALACMQAQAWTNDVIKDVVRDGMSGILPLEVKCAMWKHLSDFETDLHKWWRMINFTYNPQDDQIIVYVLMISKAQRKWISPIIALGLNLNSSVMQQIGYKLWAIKQNNTWRAVELEACNEEPDVGYVCNNNAIQSCGVCLNRNKGECYYRLDPCSSNESMIVYVGRTCVCIRSWCTMFKVNHVYDIAHNPYENQCLCNISSLVGCDVEFTLPVTVNDEIQGQYQLYEQISLIPLGLNVSLVRKLIEHPELQKQVEKAKENAQNVLITVHHSARQIEQVMEQIKGITKHCWWRIFLELSSTAKKYLNILVHPIVMLLITQIAVAITLLGNCDQRFLPQDI
uniref:Uncharacterized protein n=1 Tax=Pelusios castaneus TaxID=367368 RepID=A0A8C8R7M0_9SAUR